MPAVCAVCFPCHSAINSPLEGRTSWHCKCWKRKNQKHPISLWRACNLKIFTNSANDNLKSKQFLGRGRGTNQSHPSAKSPFERGHILPSLGSGDLSPCPAAGPGSAQPDSASSTQVDLFQAPCSSFSAALSRSTDWFLPSPRKVSSPLRPKHLGVPTVPLIEQAKGPLVALLSPMISVSGIFCAGTRAVTCSISWRHKRKRGRENKGKPPLSCLLWYKH